MAIKEFSKSTSVFVPRITPCAQKTGLYFYFFLLRRLRHVPFTLPGDLLLRHKVQRNVLYKKEKEIQMLLFTL